MPSRVVTVTSSTYLQVPKVLPYRKSRSRSRSKESKPRTFEVVEPQPLRARLPSPAMADLHERRLCNSTHTNRTCSPAAYRTSNDNEGIKRHDSTVEDVAGIDVLSEDLNGDLYTLAPSPSPPPQLSLRERLIGAWYLESYIAYPTPTCKFQRPTYPMTKNVTGLIMYTPDGYMSAHMLIPGQQSFKRGEGEEAQWAEAGKRSFCYAGPYYISNEGAGRGEILRHTFQVCNLPGWVKDVQVRTWNFEENDDLLVLGSEAPTEIKGDQRIPILKWRRARDNSNGVPPAPTPQIKVSGPGEP